MHGKLLIIDDDPDILIVLSNKLEKKGYDVTMARDGAMALEMIEKKRPDLVLLDLHMPKIDGVEAFRVIQEIHPFVGVILITGDVKRNLDMLIDQEGLWDFVTKPFDYDYLGKSIANMLIRQKLMIPLRAVA